MSGDNERSIPVCALSVEWVSKFLDRLNDAQRVLAGAAKVFDTTKHLASFLGSLQTNERCTWDQIVAMNVKAVTRTPTGNYRKNPDTGEDEEEVRDEMLQLREVLIPLGILMQIFQPLLIHFAEVCRVLEEDSGSLQELLGAIGAFQKLGELRLQMTDGGLTLVPNGDDKPGAN